MGASDGVAPITNFLLIFIIQRQVALIVIMWSLCNVNVLQ